MKSSTVIITGGAGFIGHHLACHLSEKFKVVVIDNFERGKLERIKTLDNVECLDIDLQDKKLLLKSLSKISNIECIFHLAAINGTGNFYRIPLRILETGVLSCLHILDVARHLNIKKIVLASSAEVYQDCDIKPTPEDVPLVVPSVENPRFSYGLSKIFTEYYGYHFGMVNDLNLSIFRPHNVYGSEMGNDHIVPAVVRQFFDQSNQSTVTLDMEGSLSASRAFCHISDVVRGIDMVFRKNQGVNVYNIGNPEVVDIQNLVKKIGGIFEKPYEFLSSNNIHLGGVEYRCPDIKKIANLGFVPLVNLDLGLKDYIDWYKQSRIL